MTRKYTKKPRTEQILFVMPRRNSICGHEVAKYNQKSGAMQIYFGGAESTDHEVQIRNHNQGGRQGDSNQDQLYRRCQLSVSCGVFRTEQPGRKCMQQQGLAGRVKATGLLLNR